MAILPKAFLLLLLAVIYVQLREVVVTEHDRCQCEKSTLMSRARKDTIDIFSVTFKRKNCAKLEIIMIQKPEYKTSNSGLLCLNPYRNQGKILINCWARLSNINTTSLKMSACW